MSTEATKTSKRQVVIEVPDNEDPKVFAAKAAKLIQKAELDQARRQLYNEARNLAFRKLRDAHPDEFAKLLKEARAELKARS